MVLMQKWKFSVVFALASVFVSEVLLRVFVYFWPVSHSCIISSSISMPNISAAALQYSQERALLKILPVTVNLWLSLTQILSLCVFTALSLLSVCLCKISCIIGKSTSLSGSKHFNSCGFSQLTLSSFSLFKQRQGRQGCAGSRHSSLICHIRAGTSFTVAGYFV